VEQIISGLHDLIRYFYDRDKCSVGCSSILLGALTRQLHLKGLLYPGPTNPFIGYSVVETIEAVHGFTTPALRNPKKSHSSDHVCSLSAFTEPTINSLGDGIEGLTLGDFQL
jgi:hypothetical protein